MVSYWLDVLQSDEEPALRERAATEIGKHWDDPNASVKLIPALIDALAPAENDPFGGVPDAAIYALAEMGEQAVRPLTRALRHEDEWTRAGAARALGVLVWPTAVPALVETLADPDVGVRACVAEALGNMGDERAIESLADFRESGEAASRRWRTVRRGQRRR